MLYLRDRAVLNRHFAELGPEGWAVLAKLEHAEPEDNPTANAALRVFLGDYELPEFARRRLTDRALDDLAAAFAQRDVPDWAASMLTPGDLSDVAKRGKKGGAT